MSIDRITAWFKLTKPEYYADFFITPPLTLLALALSAKNGIDLLWFGQLVVGIAVWTLYEYVAHRWLLHKVPVARDLHALHHENQQDYIALHPLATLSLYIGGWLIFGFQQMAGMVGFSLGYVFYSILHTLFHYAAIKRGHILFNLKRHHAIHHRFDDSNFGVTTTFWDALFGTARTV